jgi:hypothetical protein
MLLSSLKGVAVSPIFTWACKELAIYLFPGAGYHCA